MKKLKRFWLNIPRKARVALNLLAIALAAFCVYALIGCPAFTVEQKYRRAEKANLVGPAEIIEIVHMSESARYDQMLVADDGDGIILYTYSDLVTNQGKLCYYERSGPVTVLAAPDFIHFGSEQIMLDLPILLFDDYPRADRAELELTLGAGLDMGDYERTYRLETHRDNGYFRFNIHLQSSHFETTPTGRLDGTPLGDDGYALELFSRMMDPNDTDVGQYVPATVRLYDRDGALVAEEHLTIRSRAGENYARKEGIS